MTEWKRLLRTIVRRAFLRGMPAVPLFCCLAAVATPGCRENPPVTPPATPPSTLLSWAVGDCMWFDTWALDSNGYSIPSTKCVSTRRVIATGLQFQGRQNVVEMVDSIAIPGRPPRIDSLYFSQTSSGDLWQFGLLASLGGRYGVPGIGPGWDPIALLSGNSSSWTVGYADTTGPVLGTITTESTYFAVIIGGVNFVFQTQRVDLSGPTIGYSFWIASSPSVFAAIVEETSPAANGLYRVVTTARLATL